MVLVRGPFKLQKFCMGRSEFGGRIRRLLRLEREWITHLDQQRQANATNVQQHTSKLVSTLDIVNYRSIDNIFVIEQLRYSPSGRCLCTLCTATLGYHG